MVTKIVSKESPEQRAAVIEGFVAIAMVMSSLFSFSFYSAPFLHILVYLMIFEKQLMFYLELLGAEELQWINGCLLKSSQCCYF